MVPKWGLDFMNIRNSLKNNKIHLTALKMRTVKPLINALNDGH